MYTYFPQDPRSSHWPSTQRTLFIPLLPSRRFNSPKIFLCVIYTRLPYITTESWKILTLSSTSVSFMKIRRRSTNQTFRHRFACVYFIYFSVTSFSFHFLSVHLFLLFLLKKFLSTICNVRYKLQECTVPVSTSSVCFIFGLFILLPSFLSVVFYLSILNSF